MAAVWLIVRTNLRHRLRSLCLLVLLVGLVGAVVVSSIAGARRTDSALPRLMEQTRNDDASVEVSPDYFDAIAALPEVEAVAPASFMFVQPLGFESDDLVPMATTDERFGNEVNRLRLLDGRRPSPEKAEEVLLNSKAAAQLRVRPGDHITLSSLTPPQLEQLIAGENPGEPSGPTIEVVVVGVGVAAEGLTNRALIILFTPAFYAAYREDVGHFDDILAVRLKRGDEDLAAFREGVRRVVPESEGAIIETTAETVGEFESATGVEATALIAFAVAAALAGAVAIMQALSRQIASSNTEQSGLRELGCSERLRFTALLLPVVIVAMAGAVLAIAAATLASPIMPIGFAREAEPDPGFATDWLVFALGAFAIVLIVCGGSALTAWRSVRRPAERPESITTGRLISQLARAGASPAALVGVRMAVQPGQRRSILPVRPALAGAVMGVAGLVGALTFGAGLHWVVSDDDSYGWKWDASVAVPSGGDELGELTSALAEQSQVSGVAALGVLPVVVGGEPLTSYGLDPRRGADFLTILEGREPRGEDEVLVGSLTLERLGYEVGERVTVASVQGGAARDLTIVGRGVFPEFIHPAVPDSDTGAYNDFVLFTAAGNRPFAADAGGEYFGLVLVRWRAGVDAAEAERQLAGNGVTVAPTTLPSNLANLTRVEEFPLIVAAFLVLLAGLALGHALVTSVQRRARDLAVLKTLGFVRSQVRATLAAQASTIAAIGVVLGIPIGLVVGRVVWATVARNLGVDSYIPTPIVAIALTIPMAFLLANLIAALPARAAVRARVGDVLRRG